MINIWLLLALSFLQDIPFKPKEEFDIKLKYEFKPRPQNAVTVDYSVDDVKDNSGSLPYLTLNVHVLQAAGALKARIVSNKNDSAVKKIKEGTVLTITVGYTDDAKDRVTAHEYTIYFVDGDKKDLSKIVIHIEEDGTFLVNGERRGKF